MQHPNPFGTSLRPPVTGFQTFSPPGIDSSPPGTVEVDNTSVVQCSMFRKKDQVVLRFLLRTSKDTIFLCYEPRTTLNEKNLIVKRFDILTNYMNIYVH